MNFRDAPELDWETGFLVDRRGHGRCSCAPDVPLLQAQGSGSDAGPTASATASRRVGWLRAAVLGANDGIVSTASLMIGVAAANASNSAIVVAGLAGLVAGAMSMAAGEYVSVSSQRDTEHADIRTEERELAATPDLELDELTRHLRRSAGSTTSSPARSRRSSPPPTRSARTSATSSGCTDAGARPPVAGGGRLGRELRARCRGPARWLAGRRVRRRAHPGRSPASASSLLAITGAIGGRLGGAPMLARPRPRVARSAEGLGDGARPRSIGEPRRRPRPVVAAPLRSGARADRFAAATDDAMRASRSRAARIAADRDERGLADTRASGSSSA